MSLGIWLKQIILMHGSTNLKVFSLLFLSSGFLVSQNVKSSFFMVTFHHQLSYLLQHMKIFVDDVANYELPQESSNLFKI